jgi:hypothetical protein
VAWLVTPETLPRLLACAERASIVFDLSLLKIGSTANREITSLSTTVTDGHRSLPLGAWLDVHDVDLLHEWPCISGISPSPDIEDHVIAVPQDAGMRLEEDAPLEWRPLRAATADLREVVRLRWEYYCALTDGCGATASAETVDGTSGAAVDDARFDLTRTTRLLVRPQPDDAGCPEMTVAEHTHVATVPGHLHPWDAEGLHRLARLATGPVVELGSFLGRSTVALLLGARHSAQRVFAIAPWTPVDRMPPGTSPFRSDLDAYLSFCRHVAPWSDDLEVHCARSRNVDWQGHRIGALVIDAAPSYDEVTSDFQQFAPLLQPGARVAFHKYLPERTLFPGVRRFVEEQMLLSGEWEWDDLRGALLTLVRASSPAARDVVARNVACLERARARIRETEPSPCPAPEFT